MRRQQFSFRPPIGNTRPRSVIRRPLPHSPRAPDTGQAGNHSSGTHRDTGALTVPALRLPARERGISRFRKSPITQFFRARARAHHGQRRLNGIPVSLHRASRCVGQLAFARNAGFDGQQIAAHSSPSTPAPSTIPDLRAVSPSARP